jgi:phosphotransacetylase
MLMRPVFNAAALPKAQRTRGLCRRRDERVLRAVQLAIDDGLAHPILIGRPAVIQARIAKAGLRMQLGKDVNASTLRTIPASASTGRPTTAHGPPWGDTGRSQGRRAPLQHRSAH